MVAVISLCMNHSSALEILANILTTESDDNMLFCSVYSCFLHLHIQALLPSLPLPSLPYYELLMKQSIFSLNSLKKKVIHNCAST